MAGNATTTWPQTADGKTDWETVFEAPETGLISLIMQARSPSALRKSTIFVIESIYSTEGGPPEILGFADELEAMLPDNLPKSALPKVADAIAVVLREMKEERIRRENDADGLNGFDGLDDFDDFEEPRPKKKNTKTARKRSRGGKKDKKKKSGSLILAGILGLALLIGGGGYYYFFMEHGPEPEEMTRTLIDQMLLAAEGNGPDVHVFGGELQVVTRSDLTGVTAFDVPAENCRSVAWYFINRGNILINDRMPNQISPNLLKRFCDEKGETAKVMWLSEKKPQEENGESSEQPDENTQSSEQ